jgi:hypothetical protein
VWCFGINRDRNDSFPALRPKVREKRGTEEGWPFLAPLAHINRVAGGKKWRNSTQASTANRKNLTKLLKLEKINECEIKAILLRLFLYFSLI